MAIYHHSTQVISRKSGQSACASAAYRSAEKLYNERDGITHDYGRKDGVVHTEILAPENVPEWATNREKLWNEVEKAEKRVDSQLAREVNIALPTELNREEQIKLVTEYAKENYVDKGMIADVCVHDKGDGNPHAHIMLTLRDIDKDGFGKKNRDWNEHSLATEYRKNWAEKVNHELEKRGHEQRLDHRSYKEQGIEKIPTIHEGAIARKIDGRENQIGDRCEINRDIARENQRLEQYQKQEKLCQQLKVMAEREPEPVVQKRPELPQQRQKEEVQPSPPTLPKEPQQQPEGPVIDKTEITLDALLEQVKEYNAVLMARDMEREARISAINKEIAEIIKPYRAEAIETFINEKWGMKWAEMQEEKRSLTREIQRYNSGDSYGFWDKHVNGKYEKDGQLLRQKSGIFDEREKELLSTMNRTRNELSAGGGRDIGEVNRLADRIASEREPRCQDRIQELQKERNSVELERRNSMGERSEMATLRDNIRKVKERSSGDRKLLIFLGQEKGKQISFAKSMESPKIREEMKLAANKLNLAMHNEYKQLRDHRHSLSHDREDTGRGGRSR